MEEIRKYGTERCEKLLKLLGNPDGKLKIIHIAGTNGKGSTAAYISAVIAASGAKVGTFTSPKVYSYVEQFCINCLPVAEDKIRAYKEEVEKVAEDMADSPSPFETETAAAILAFYGEGCGYAVLECGLGGRDDATNAVCRKEVAVFTSISLEHTAELGNTLRGICEAKSGIIKNCPVVVSAYQSGGVKDFFKSFDPVFAGEGLTEIPTGNGLEGQSFRYKGEEYFINMSGRAQLYNAAAAIETCRLLGIDNKYIVNGLRAARLRGRIETLRLGGTEYILDGAHNPGALKELVGSVVFDAENSELVFGCLSDKDVYAAAEILAPHFSRAILFEPDSPRAMKLGKIVGAFEGKIKIETAYSVCGALEKARGGKVAVCGSFTFIKEAAEWINRRR